ncbi:Mitochondrial carrier domain protein [Akanthomyces lecanii RCEF 1005]|uniref:Mitochondrial carrier domain protein n=1 Tax=Akanthomyces lecanii RCEF 1005 TaxID=1081108 RepID=A0A168CVV6_CORDF|nr:Mitochondrial carrier domain protein [Akanthomyces lecanii RCEF 1005]
MSLAQAGSLLASPSEAREAAAKPTTKIQPTPLVSLISGGIAGGVEATVTYPFEFAKTRAQLQAFKSSSTNPFSVIIQTARQDGIRSIYTGCSTLVLGTTFKAGVRFLSFDYIKNMLVDDHGRLSASRGVLAGMVAGAVESIVAVTPTERIKIALIDDAKSGRRRFNGGTHAVSLMVREKGVGELYRGLASTTVKQSATSAVRMGTYNMIKELCKKHNVPQNTAATFVSGAVAGVVTVYATQPFDSIKTVAQGVDGASTGEAFRHILNQRGIRGFWSGSTMRLGRLILSGGIVFTVYEQVVGIMTGVHL